MDSLAVNVLFAGIAVFALAPPILRGFWVTVRRRPVAASGRLAVACGILGALFFFALFAVLVLKSAAPAHLIISLCWAGIAVEAAVRHWHSVLVFGLVTESSSMRALRHAVGKLGLAFEERPSGITLSSSGVELLLKQAWHGRAVLIRQKGRSPNVPLSRLAKEMDLYFATNQEPTASYVAHIQAVLVDGLLLATLWYFLLH